MEWIWSESVWCPPNVRWADFRPDSAQIKDLYYSFITAFALILMRFVFEFTLFRPLGRILCSGGSPSGRSKVAGDSNKYKNFKSKTVNKFSEGMWRMSFYLFAAIYGWFFVLWDKRHLKDTMHTLYNYPHHPVQPEEWWYYNLELGFYISLIVTQMVDTKRKDFWQMFVHHIVTVMLLVGSWACNFHRIGSLVLAIHDIADVPLEGAKLAKYCNRQRLADLLFGLFTVTWIYSRCYLLPTRVLYYTTYGGLSVVPIFPAYFIFNGLLCLLQILHFAWTWLILRMVFDAIRNAGMRDLRSESEESDDIHED